MKKKNLTFILNFLHPVYDGYLSFFAQYYNFSLYSIFGGYINKEKFYKQYEDINFTELKDVKSFCSTVYVFNKNEVKVNTNEIIIVGDTFTNSLAYTIRGKNILYYGEYILYKGKFLKNILFYILGFIFFYNKKIIVPTKLAYNTYSKISKNIFYFPQLYCNEIENRTINDSVSKNKTINLLTAIYDLSGKAKNISFLIENYLLIKKEYPNIQLTLVGNSFNLNFLKPYQNDIKNGKIIYIPYLKKEELHEVYKKSDVFILPSIREPIGSVILEAMSHGCAILTSSMVGASSYIENGKNGFVFEVNNFNDFKEKLLVICNDIEIYRKKSIEILKQNYRIKNKNLTDKIYNDLETFLKK